MPACAKCGAQIPSAAPLPGELPVCPKCADPLNPLLDLGDYQLAPPPEIPQGARRPDPPPKRPVEPEDTPQEKFFCRPLLVVLLATIASMTCLCPLSMFFDFPKGLLLLGGMGMVFGGIFWFGFRFKHHTGQGMTDESPWYLRGGLTTMLQLTGYVIQEPVVFGPPFSVLVLGLLLCVSPIFIPDLRHYFQPNPVMMGPPPAPPAAAPEAPPKQAAIAEAALPTQEPPSVPPAAKTPPTLSELFDRRATAYLTELQEYDVQAGLCPIGKHGNLGNGSRIVVQGKESPNGVGMHPPNPPLVAKASFRIERQRAKFEGSVALNDTATEPWGAAIFAVHGDGKLLWKSAPIKSRGSAAGFSLDLDDVEALELSVVVDGLAHYVHAVWVEPRLVKR